MARSVWFQPIFFSSLDELLTYIYLFIHCFSHLLFLFVFLAELIIFWLTDKNII